MNKREAEKDSRKEKQQWERESKTWVVKDEMLLEHFILKDPNVYAFFFFLYPKSKYLIFPFHEKNLVSTF